MSENVSEIRKRAWATRRKAYGPNGHRGTYARGQPACAADCQGMLALIIRLHNEGTLSEGQVARATGLERIEIRRLADDAREAQS